MLTGIGTAAAGVRYSQKKRMPLSKDHILQMGSAKKKVTIKAVFLL